MPRLTYDILHRQALHVRLTKDMGLGVFAAKRIRKGEIIEVCPVIPLSKSDERKAQSMAALCDYIFAWGKRPCLSCIVLGFGSIYNHSKLPNATYRQRKSRKQLVFAAMRDIKKGEQIFIDYEWEDAEYKRMGMMVTPNGTGAARPTRRRSR